MTTTASATRNLGTLDDVRAILPLPKSSLYERARNGRIPGVTRVGRRMLFDLNAIEQWIDAGGDFGQPPAKPRKPTKSRRSRRARHDPATRLATQRLGALQTQILIRLRDLMNVEAAFTHINQDPRDTWVEWRISEMVDELTPSKITGVSGALRALEDRGLVETIRLAGGRAAIVKLTPLALDWLAVEAPRE